MKAWWRPGTGRERETRPAQWARTGWRLAPRIGSVVVAATLLLTGFGGQSAAAKAAKRQGKPAAQGHVIVGVYGGTWQTAIEEAALNQFQKQTGIQVDVVPGADAEWFAKVRAAGGHNPPYDLLILQPDTIQLGMAEGLLQPITQKDVPNLADVYPIADKPFERGGKTYAVAYSIGQLGIAYRKDLVKNPPKGWLDLWKPEYKGHVAIPPLTYSAGLQFFVGVIHALGGTEANPADVNRAFAKLAQLKPNIVAYPDNAGPIQTLLTSGGAWLVPFWDGRAFAMRASGEPIGFVYPKDGPVAAVASWAIVKGAPDLQNAYKLLNYMLSARAEGIFAQKEFYGMSNKDVRYGALSRLIATGESAYAHLTLVDYRVVDAQLANWTNRWTQVMGSR
jgi:putative spermidine/putrescine transport system substrate-binding protein